MDDVFDICRNGNEAKNDESQPRTIMKEQSSGRNCGWQHAVIMTPPTLGRRSRKELIAGDGFCSENAADIFRAGPLIAELVNSTHWLISARGTQASLGLDKADDAVEPLAFLKVGHDERTLAPHAPGPGIHFRQRRPDIRREI